MDGRGSATPHKAERILARSVAGISVFLEHEGVAQVEGAAVLLAVGTEPELWRLARMQPIQELAHSPTVDHAGQYRMYGMGEGLTLVATPAV